MTGSKLQLQGCSLLLEIILLNYKAGKFINGYTNTKLLEILVNTSPYLHWKGWL